MTFTVSASSSSIRGVRIWLSGAVPNEATDYQRRAILDFVGQFASAVFRAGGHILHGSHPTLTPILVEEAKKHRENGGHRDCLTLAVSRLWSKFPDKVPVNEWREICLVYETPEASGEGARKESLRILRLWMSERSDAFIAVGGNWWRQVAGRAGVPEEAGLAIERGMPCFLLGGLNGATRDFIRNHPDLSKSLRNGLDEASNQDLVTERRVGRIVTRICDQLSRLPLIRGRVSDGISFRILALDGGGIKGAFSASVLATLEQSLKTPITAHFDMIAGTSTGGILAVGFGMGLTSKQMLRFYRERGPTIFPITSLRQRWKHNVRHLVRPKHSQDVLREELQSAYFSGNRPKTLGDSECRLVIPTYDAISGTCRVFRTPHHQLLTFDKDANAVDVALATAAAPTYFSGAKVPNSIANPVFFDGGVWANSPVMAAIVEAVCYLGVPLDRLDILSIGTTEEPFNVKRNLNSGILGWGKSLIDLLMNSQVESSVRHAEQLVGEPRFLRINTITKPRAYSLDSPKNIEDLISLGNQLASEPAIVAQVKSRFLNGVHCIPWKQPSSV